MAVEEKRENPAAVKPKRQFLRRWARGAREFWRVAKIPIAALPAAVALGYLSFHSPSDVSPKPRRLMTSQEAKAMQVDNWALGDPVIQAARAGTLTPPEFVKWLNYPDDSYTDSFGSFYGVDPVDGQIYHVNLTLNEKSAEEFISRIFTKEQQRDLWELYNVLEKKLGLKRPRPPQIGPAGDGIVTEADAERWNNHVMATLFSKQVLSRLDMNDPNWRELRVHTQRLSSIIKATRIENVRDLNERYYKINRLYKKAYPPFASAALAGLLAVGSVVAARQAFKKSTSRKSLAKAARQAISSGGGPSLYRMLRHHVGSYYAAVLSVMGGQEITGALAEHLNSAAQLKADDALARITRKHRRAQLNSDNLRNYVVECYRESTRPLFYAFWGGWKESKSGLADENEDNALRRLAEMAGVVSQAGLRKPELRVIFTDSHALLNGAEKVRIDAYYKSLLPLAKKHGIKLMRLSKLEGKRAWRQAERNAAREIGDVDDYVRRILHDDAVRETLEEGARNHSLFFKRREITLQEAIRRYAKRRVLEGRVLEKLPGWRGLHLAFADPHALGALMNLPTLLLYSMGKGDSRPPWFTEGTPLPQAVEARSRSSLRERFRGQVRRFLPSFAKPRGLVPYPARPR